MKKKVLALFAASLLGVVSSAYANSNLITNGGFDSGLSGWTTFTTPNGNLGSGLPIVATFDTTGSGASPAAMFQVGENSYTGAYEGGGISQTFNVAAGGTYNFSVNVASLGGIYTNGSGGSFSILVDSSSLASWNSSSIPAGQTLRSSLVGSETLTAGNHTLSLLVERPYKEDGTTPYQYLDNVSVAAVPEPETYAMMLAGLGLMGFMVHRKKTA